MKNIAYHSIRWINFEGRLSHVILKRCIQKFDVNLFRRISGIKPASHHRIADIVALMMCEQDLVPTSGGNSGARRNDRASLNPSLCEFILLAIRSALRLCISIHFHNSLSAVSCHNEHSLATVIYFVQSNVTVVASNIYLYKHLTSS